MNGTAPPVASTSALPFSPTSEKENLAKSVKSASASPALVATKLTSPVLSHHVTPAPEVASPMDSVPTTLPLPLTNGLPNATTNGLPSKRKSPPAELVVKADVDAMQVDEPELREEKRQKVDSPVPSTVDESRMRVDSPKPLITLAEPSASIPAPASSRLSPHPGPIALPPLPSNTDLEAAIYQAVASAPPTPNATSVPLPPLPATATESPAASAPNPLPKNNDLRIGGSAMTKSLSSESGKPTKPPPTPFGAHRSPSNPIVTVVTKPGHRAPSNPLQRATSPTVARSKAKSPPTGPRSMMEKKNSKAPGDKAKSKTSLPVVPVVKTESVGTNGLPDAILPGRGKAPERTAGPEDVIHFKGFNAAAQPCAWNPKVDTLLATGAGDASVRIYDVPATGGGKDVPELVVCRHAAGQRKVEVHTVQWNVSDRLSTML